jgi:hypothetical protein
VNLKPLEMASYRVFEDEESNVSSVRKGTVYPDEILYEYKRIYYVSEDMANELNLTYVPFE